MRSVQGRQNEEGEPICHCVPASEPTLASQQRAGKHDSQLRRLAEPTRTPPAPACPAQQTASAHLSASPSATACSMSSNSCWKRSWCAQRVRDTPDALPKAVTRLLRGGWGMEGGAARVGAGHMQLLATGGTPCSALQARIHGPCTTLQPPHPQPPPVAPPPLQAQSDCPPRPALLPVPLLLPRCTG